MKTTTKICLLVLSVIFFYACSNKPNLQKYIVEHQEASSFMSLDIPLSVDDVQMSKLSERQVKALKTLKRINFLGYSLSNGSKAEYEEQLATVTSLLAGDDYVNLLEFKDPKASFTINFIGNKATTDEIVLFGSFDSIGFGIVRILGDDMDLNSIFALLDNLEKGPLNELSNEKLKNLMQFFNPSNQV